MKIEEDMQRYGEQREATLIECRGRIGAKARSSTWATTMAPAAQHEWLVDCYPFSPLTPRTRRAPARWMRRCTARSN